MPADPAQVALDKVLTYSAKLVEALDALDDAGGLRRFSATMKPALREKTRATLKETRQALDAAAEQLKPPKPKPRPAPVDQPEA